MPCLLPSINAFKPWLTPVLITSILRSLRPDLLVGLDACEPHEALAGPPVPASRRRWTRNIWLARDACEPHEGRYRQAADDGRVASARDLMQEVVSHRAT